MVFWDVCDCNGWCGHDDADDADDDDDEEDDDDRHEEENDDHDDDDVDNWDMSQPYLSCQEAETWKVAVHAVPNMSCVKWLNSYLAHHGSLTSRQDSTSGCPAELVYAFKPNF